MNRIIWRGKNDEKKEVIEALTAIKGYCDEHYCGDCCIRYICDNNFSGFPDDWEIPGVEDTLPVVYIKPVNGGKVPEKKTDAADADAEHSGTCCRSR